MSVHFLAKSTGEMLQQTTPSILIKVDMTETGRAFELNLLAKTWRIS